ncbi:N-alpha-acetyltransferase, non-catalitic subunit [Mycoemilia scoparia]|uniref:N-alpha-acetyltransferase, non-catalitic subunit n=1 Tax=Mycoemilia scoparia TaxID=417184 RepID=A0A9W8A1G3_9FUNG|nr:N-alpha-acetyltransferase, non-catalitic subunit [Mycoemilia scoparia]
MSSEGDKQVPIDLSNSGSRFLEPYDNLQSRWRDVTSLLFDGAPQLEIGELLHDNDFTLFESISALEIMDPRLDSNMQEFNPDQDASQAFCPDYKIDLGQCLWIIDTLFRCEMAWLRANDLSRTLLTCLYIYRPDWIQSPLDEINAREKSPMDIRNKVLLPYIVATWQCVEGVLSELTKEEDYSGYKFGMDSLLEPLEKLNAYSLLETAKEWLEYAKSAEEYQNQAHVINELLLRIRLRKTWLSIITSVDPPYLLQANGAFDSISKSIKSIQTISSIISKRSDQTKEMYHEYPPAFDPMIGRFMSMYTPLQKLDLPPINECLDDLSRISMDLNLVKDMLSTSSVAELLDFFDRLSIKDPVASPYVRSLIQSVLSTDDTILLQSDNHSFLRRALFENGGSVLWNIQEAAKSLGLGLTEEDMGIIQQTSDVIFNDRSQLYLSWLKIQSQNPSRIRRLAINHLSDLQGLFMIAKDSGQSVVCSLYDKGQNHAKKRELMLDLCASITDWIMDMMLKASETVIFHAQTLGLYKPYEISGMYTQAKYLYKALSNLWLKIHERSKRWLDLGDESWIEANELDTSPVPLYLQLLCNYEPAKYCPKETMLRHTKLMGDMYSIKQEASDLLALTAMVFERLNIINPPWAQCTQTPENREHALNLELKDVRKARYTLRWRGLFQVEDLGFCTFEDYEEISEWLDDQDVVSFIKNIRDRWVQLEQRIASFKNHYHDTCKDPETAKLSHYRSLITSLEQVIQSQSKLFDPWLENDGDPLYQFHNATFDHIPKRPLGKSMGVSRSDINMPTERLGSLEISEKSPKITETIIKEGDQSTLNEALNEISKRWKAKLESPFHPYWVIFMLEHH